MKDIRLWVLLMLVGVMLASCGNGKKKGTGWSDAVHEVVTRQMPDLRVTDSLQSGSHMYAYEIVRVASDSLPKVKDDMDDLYLDNIIQLTLCRDGKEYFRRTFTKATFASSIEEAFYQNAILDGIRFLKAEQGKGLVFSFAVSYPDSDMSVPFLMTITDQGTFSFVKDENLDREEGDSVYFDSDGV